MDRTFFVLYIGTFFAMNRIISPLEGTNLSPIEGINISSYEPNFTKIIQL